MLRSLPCRQSGDQHVAELEVLRPIDSSKIAYLRDKIVRVHAHQVARRDRNLFRLVAKIIPIDHIVEQRIEPRPRCHWVGMKVQDHPSKHNENLARPLLPDFGLHLGRDLISHLFSTVYRLPCGVSAQRVSYSSRRLTSQRREHVANLRQGKACGLPSLHVISATLGVATAAYTDVLSGTTSKRLREREPFSCNAFTGKFSTMSFTDETVRGARLIIGNGGIGMPACDERSATNERK